MLTSKIGHLQECKPLCKELLLAVSKRHQFNAVSLSPNTVRLLHQLRASLKASLSTVRRLLLPHARTTTTMPNASVNKKSSLVNRLKPDKLTVKPRPIKIA